MADYVVRFVGDLGNLAQFNASIRSALSQNSGVLSRANQGVVSRALGQPVVGPNQVGFGIRNPITELDQYNKAVIQSGQVVQQYIKDYEAFQDARGNFQVRPVFDEQYFTNFRLAIANLDDYAKAAGKLKPVEDQILSIRQQAAQQVATLRNASLGAILPSGRVTDSPIDYESTIKSIQAKLSSTINPQFLAGLTFPTATNQKFDETTGINSFFVSPKSAKLAQAQITLAFDDQEQFIKSEMQKRISAIENDPIVKAFADSAFFSATNPQGYIGQNGAYALQNQKVQQDLIKRTNLGLGATPGTQDFYKNAEAQGFQVDKIYQDMERNLTRISGSIRTGQLKDLNGDLIKSSGVLNEFSYALDKNGNIVQTWGRSLAGARGFLPQTVRDLQKVVEWTVATTVVFGALGTAITSISGINQLNQNLQRFSITARLSRDDLNSLFKGLADIAVKTATPLNELVSAADDMALATRRANQTTQEWHSSILELANAVGILTNISGLSTVEATDLLTASMKQLDLTTADLIPLLNQITAAAGGQANSIKDIATGLSSLAEAAQEAGISVTGQIAAIQVISLATNKSADETASAFKNLFGAINADISVKKLAEFGIAVRDSTGNLRPFLDIYKDIADAINKGIIPEGRVNEVLRAISGGRTGRQADAAALISNIYKVIETEGVAANASNESLIANAQILDTNKAKLTQFQSAFQFEVYEKFNKAVQDLVGSLAALGKGFADFIGLIPQPVISLITQLGALIVAFQLLSKVGSTLALGQAFGNIASGLNRITTESKATTAAVEALSAEELITQRGIGVGFNKSGSTFAQLPNGIIAGQRTNGSYYFQQGGKFISPEQAQLATMTVAVEEDSKNLLRNFINKLGGKVAVGGAIGGAILGAVSSQGQGTLSTLASITQFAGLGATVAGGPVLGLPLLVASAGLQAFAQSEQDVKQQTNDLQQSIYNLSEQWKIDQAGVDAARETYDIVQGSLESASKGTQDYINLQGQLGTAAVDLNVALNQQNTTLQSLSTTLQKLNGLQGGFADYIGNIQNVGNLSPEQVRQLQSQVSYAILQSSGQGIVSQNLPIGFDPNTLNYTQSNNNPLSYRPLGGSGLQSFTPEQILNQNTFKSIIDILNTSKGLGLNLINNEKPDLFNFPYQNQQAVAAFRAAAGEYEKGLNQDQLNNFLDNVMTPFEAAVREFGTYIDQIGSSVKEAQQQLQTQNLLGLLTKDQSNAAGSRINAANQLSELLSSPNVVNNKDLQQQIATEISSLITPKFFQSPDRQSGSSLNTANFGKADATQLADIYLKSQGLDKFVGNVTVETRALNKEFGFTSEQLKAMGFTGDEVLGTMQDEIDSLTKASNDFANTELQNLAQKFLDLQARLQGGEFKGGSSNKQYQFLLTQYQSEQKAILATRDAAIELEKTLGPDGAQKAVEQLGVTLTNAGVNGFLGLTGSIDNATGAFFNWISALNLSGKNVDKAVQDWTRLIKVVTLLSFYMNAVNNLGALAGKIIPNSTGGPDERTGGTSYATLYQQIISGLNSQLKSISSDLSAIGKTGTGTSTPGGSTKTANPLNVSSLYLTDEQRKLFDDPTAIIKQAYADALKLQAQIPGEKKRDANDVVVVFDGLQKIFKERGVSEELLRKALDELTNQMQKFNAKADTVRRIRVGGGDFAAIANVPVNSITGVSMAGSNGPINVTLNLNGTLLTPAQFQQFANMVAAAISRQL